MDCLLLREIIIDPMPDSEQFQQFFIELAKQQLSAEITGAGDTQDPPPLLLRLFVVSGYHARDI